MQPRRRATLRRAAWLVRTQRRRAGQALLLLLTHLKAPELMLPTCPCRSHADLQLHQPHRAARGDGEVACGNDGEAAATPHADHLRCAAPRRAAPRCGFGSLRRRGQGAWQRGRQGGVAEGLPHGAAHAWTCVRPHTRSLMPCQSPHLPLQTSTGASCSRCGSALATTGHASPSCRSLRRRRAARRRVGGWGCPGYHIMLEKMAGRCCGCRAGEARRQSVWRHRLRPAPPYLPSKLRTLTRRRRPLPTSSCSTHGIPGSHCLLARQRRGSHPLGWAGLAGRWGRPA